MSVRSIPLILMLVLCGCSGGGGSQSNVPAGDNTTGNSSVLTGVFSDSPVQGLHFETATQSGLTDANGRFRYQAGETVTFSLGATTIGSAPGAPEVTPLDVVGATDVDDAEARGLMDRLTNILLFLQSLDRDQDPDNGIDLSGLDDRLETALNFAVDTGLFRGGEYRRIVNRHGGRLRSSASALNHFLDAQGESITVDLPVKDSIDLDGDGRFDEVVEYEYDSEGKVVRIVRRDARADIATSTTAITWDENGNLQRIETDLSTSTIVEEFEIHPDFGLISHRVLEDGDVLSELHRFYDDTGNLVRETRSDRARGYRVNDYRLYFEFSPASAGNFVSFSPTPVGGSVLVGLTRAAGDNVVFGPFSEALLERRIETEVTYEYDSDGRPLRLVSKVSSDGSTTMFTTTYEDGRPSMTRLEIDGVVRSIVTREYGEDGEVASCQIETGGQQQVVDDHVDPFPTTNATFSFRSATCYAADDIDLEIERDDRGRITRLVQHTFNGTHEQRYIYTGGRLSESVSRHTIDGELVQEVRSDYRYDMHGNLVELSVRTFDELSFRRVREYIRLTVTRLPPGPPPY